MIVKGVCEGTGENREATLNLHSLAFINLAAPLFVFLF